MDQFHTFCGRVTADPVQEYGKDSGKPYLKLNLIYNVGFGEREKPMRVQTMFYSEFDINRILNAHVKKGSCIFVVGVIDELVTFDKKDGSEGKVEIIKMTGKGWDYLPQTAKKPEAGADGQGAEQPQGNAQSSTPPAPGDVGGYDLGDDGELPF